MRGGTPTVGKIIVALLWADLFVLDEVGFALLDDTGTQLLFRLVAGAYERRSLAIASPWPFGQGATSCRTHEVNGPELPGLHFQHGRCGNGVHSSEALRDRTCRNCGSVASGEPCCSNHGEEPKEITSL